MSHGKTLFVLRNFITFPTLPINSYVSHGQFLILLLQTECEITIFTLFKFQIKYFTLNQRWTIQQNVLLFWEVKYLMHGLRNAQGSVGKIPTKTPPSSSISGGVATV